MQHSVPLNAIRVFVAAAQLRSFQSAARTLFVTPSAVSRRIQALEAHLGVQLFRRLPREAALTRAGETFLSQVGHPLRVIEQACQQMAAGKSILRIESTSAFAMYWLIPRLQRFRNDHPDIQLELSTAQGLIDPGKQAHVFIRRSPDQFAGLLGHEFMPERSLLVCSPDCLRRNDISSARAIAGSRLIVMRSRPDLWPKWMIRHNLRDGAPADRMEFDNTILAIQAAIQGLGIALVPTLFVEGALRSGSLLPMPGFEPIDTGAYYWLCRQPERLPFVDVFTRWLVNCARPAVGV